MFLTHSQCNKQSRSEWKLQRGQKNKPSVITWLPLSLRAVGQAESPDGSCGAGMTMELCLPIKLINRTGLLSRDSSLHKAVKLSNNWVLIQTKDRTGESIIPLWQLSVWMLTSTGETQKELQGWKNEEDLLPYISFTGLHILQATHPSLSLFFSPVPSNLMWQTPLNYPHSRSTAQRRCGPPDVIGGVNGAPASCWEKGDVSESQWWWRRGSFK